MRRALAVGLAVACGGADGEDHGVTVRDSAGVEIVENTGPAFSSPQWTVSAEPEVAIGVLEGDPNYQLFQVRDATRLPSGTIVVANTGTHEMRFYDASGRFIRSVGGEGGGPGEFGGIQNVTRYGPDSLMVYDWRHRRVSVHDTSGVFGRSALIDLGGGTFPTRVEPLPDGRVLASSGGVFSGDAAAGLQRDSVPYYLVSPEGRVLDSLGRYPGWEAWVKNEGGRMGVTSRAFGRLGVVQPIGAFFYFGDSEFAELRLHRLDDAGLVRIVRWIAPPVAVTDADIDRYRSDLIEGSEEQWRDVQRQLLEGMPYPEVFPVFSQITADPTNHAFVRLFPRPGDDVGHWVVFDPDGRQLFTIDMPAGVRVVEVGREYVLGVYEDDFEVEHVVMYGLDRGRAG